MRRSLRWRVTTHVRAALRRFVRAATPRDRRLLLWALICAAYLGAWWVTRK